MMLYNNSLVVGASAPSGVFGRMRSMGCYDGFGISISITNGWHS